MQPVVSLATHNLSEPGFILRPGATLPLDDHHGNKSGIGIPGANDGPSIVVDDEPKRGTRSPIFAALRASDQRPGTVKRGRCP